MRTFKFADDKSYKFWKIELLETSFTVSFGKIGTKGQTQTKEFDTADQARKAYDKLIVEKLSKGYEETTPAAAAPASTDNVLERALRDDPDDLATHSAYADWLSQQGDPRGEFIQVQLLLEDVSRPANERQELQQREKELLAKHQAEWVGKWASLAQTEGPEGRGQVDFLGPKPFRFIRGILAELTLDRLSLDCARELVKSSETRMVQRVFLGGWSYEDDEAGQDEFSAWPYLDNLRTFQFGWTSDEVYGDFCDFQCHLRGENVVDCIKKMPGLQELRLFASEVATGDLFRLKTLNRLRVLQVYHCWEYPLELLANNPAFQNLTHLLLHPKAAGAWADPPYIPAAGVRAILGSPYLNNLTHLRLRLTDIGDRGCEEIVRSGILRRLKLLDLRHGCITDAGAHLLATCPDVKNLEFLDLSRNQLTRQGIEELLPIVKSLDVAYQHEGQSNQGDWPEYLFQGDYE